MVERINKNSKVYLLRQELDTVENHIDALKIKLGVKPDYSIGVGDPLVTSWSIDRVLLEQLEKRVASLKRALKRLDEGIYSICELCGKQINPERLAILHDTRLCIDCANKK
jgi:RNA polymerase-binding transcription factor DksA